MDSILLLEIAIPFIFGFGILIGSFIGRHITLNTMIEAKYIQASIMRLPPEARKYLLNRLSEQCL